MSKSHRFPLTCLAITCCIFSFLLGAGVRGDLIAERACLKYEPEVTHKRYMMCLKEIGDN